MASSYHSWLSSLLTETPIFFSSPFPKPKCFKISLSRSQSSPQSDSSSLEPSPEAEPTVDPVKLALEKAKAYKKAKAEQEDRGNNAADGSDKEPPPSVKIAMQKAKEYEKNKGVVASDGDNGGEEAQSRSVSKEESYVRSPNEVLGKDDSKQLELKVSSIDFMGLDFADKKKTKRLPPGLAPVVDSFPEGDLPEVEIIVGDKTKFGEPEATTAEPKQVGDDNSDVYKPKVSTWGVFPRPSNISKTFGGGRNIRPGDLLETAEEKAAKEEQTRQLLTAYKEKIGLNIDPKLKSECQKALDEGNSLMDSGKLKEALPFYEKVMDKMVFKSELHGLAALQWSICQDSLRRQNEARVMYEKLQSHPNANVSKKARQFAFSFQAMEMMKFSSSKLSQNNTGYQNYFEAFIKDKTNYTSDEPEGEDMVINQTIPYVIFLVSPILLVLIIAAQKGTLH